MQTHLKFDFRFAQWSLGLAIFAGFALGAHVISVIAFDFPLGKAFYSYVQTHGFIQLIGWTGLLIIGVSLYVIPRMAGAPIASRKLPAFVLALLAAGLLLRFTSHAVLPYVTPGAFYDLTAALVVLSGLLVCAACLLYSSILVSTMKRVANIDKRPALKSVRPFFVLMLSGWVIYPAVNAWLSAELWRHEAIVLDQSWNEFGMQLFVDLTLLPVAFAFSMRLLPLYLRLPVISWHTGRFAAFYGTAAIGGLLLQLPPVLRAATELPLLLMHMCHVLKGVVIVWFVWRLGVLHGSRSLLKEETHAGWTEETQKQDRQRFGPFHLLIKLSFTWLGLAGCIEAVRAAAALADLRVAISTDALRHLYLLGFITHLILGVTVRMLPGLLGKKKVASAALVRGTLWLGTIAVLSRVLPILLPAELFEWFPGSLVVVRAALGLSGVFGMGAVACLAVNLNKTARS